MQALRYWRDEPYDHKSDIWSLGCVLYEMISLKPPFTADDMQGLFKKVNKGSIARIPENFSNELWAMVKYLLQVNPSARPNCEQIISLPIFAKKFEKLFPEDHSQMIRIFFLGLLSFLKTSLYLPERLPKQNYTTYIQ